MSDRSGAKSAKQRSNVSSQAFTNTLSAQSHLQLGTWTNPLIQSADERHRQAPVMTIHNMSTRTINFDQNRQRNFTRSSRSNSERFAIQRFEIVKRRFITPTRNGYQMREQSAPNISSRIQSSTTQPTTNICTSPETLEINPNSLEYNQQDNQTESINQPKEFLTERLACEITMSYALSAGTTIEKSNREEITVMQRYSTGETSLVYRGYLAKGENFTFKSQRRSTSNLSLAFYVQGSIDSITNECCEYKCIQTNANNTEQKQFFFKSIQKPNPCEKCRKDHADKLLLNNDKNTLLVHRNSKFSQSYNYSEGKGSASKDQQQQQQQQQGSKHEKTKSTEGYYSYYPGTTTSVNTDASQSNKPTDSTKAQSNAIHTTNTSIVSTTESTEQKTTKKSDDNPEDSNKTETNAISDSELNSIRTQMHLAQAKQNMTRRPKSVENFCYVLERHLLTSNEEEQTLRGLINLGFTFDDINSEESTRLLNTILDEKIIFIISKTSMEKLSKPIQDEPFLCAIYVIDSSEKISFDSKFYRGSFPNITRCCEQLKNDLQTFTDDLTTICSISPNNITKSTLNYVQALKDILLVTDEDSDLKKEMIDFCREEYADNIIQLKFINEFEKNFQSNDAIDWYLRSETFIYKMMTRAFRMLDPDILFKLRYFIQHLDRQLTSSINTNTSTVHRTLRIRMDLFMKMKRNQGALLSFNEFLLVYKNQSMIEPSVTNKNSKLVHFQIILGKGVPRYDLPTKPNEVLLTVGTIFRIDKLEQIDEETFTVQLITNDDILKAGELLTDDLRQAMRAQFPSICMLKLMKHKEFTGYIEYFSSKFINDPQFMKDQEANISFGESLHFLGSYYYEKHEYEKALNRLQNALLVYLRVLPDNDIKLSPTYNNIGSIYHKQGLHEQALEYHKKAFEIQKNSKEPSFDSVASYIGNIGSILMKLHRYKEAVTYFELNLQIQQKRHPNNNHPDVAIKHHNLAGVLYRSQEYTKALEHYRKCLDIELKCHSKEDPTVAVTYYNMATVLEQLGQLEEAKDAVEKAIARLLLTKPENDEEIQTRKKYLQRLEQKIWMKNVFNTT